MHTGPLKIYFTKSCTSLRRPSAPSLHPGPMFLCCLFSNKMNKISNLFSPVSNHGYLFWVEMTAHAQGGYK